MIRYTYGLSKPENLVSDLVSNGIIKECLLCDIAEVFDDWLTGYLAYEMKRLNAKDRKPVAEVPKE